MRSAASASMFKHSFTSHEPFKIGRAGFSAICMGRPYSSSSEAISHEQFEAISSPLFSGIFIAEFAAFDEFGNVIYILVELLIGNIFSEGKDASVEISS